MNKKSVAKLLSGPVLFALCMLLIPESVLPFAERWACSFGCPRGG